MNMTIYEYKSRCEWLSKFYAEAAETGRAMQFHNGDWVDCDIGPNMQSHPDEWRVKRKKSKAWLVWERSRIYWFFHKEEADEFIKTHPGLTLQEITRPEPQ